MQKLNSTTTQQPSHLLPLYVAATRAGVTPKVFVAASRAGDIAVPVLRISGRKFVVSSVFDAWLAASRAGHQTATADLF